MTEETSTNKGLLSIIFQKLLQSGTNYEQSRNRQLKELQRASQHVKRHSTSTSIMIQEMTIKDTVFLTYAFGTEK